MVNRSHYLPFIEILQTRCVSIANSQNPKGKDHQTQMDYPKVTPSGLLVKKIPNYSCDCRA